MISKIDVLKKLFRINQILEAIPTIDNIDVLDDIDEVIRFVIEMEEKEGTAPTTNPVTPAPYPVPYPVPYYPDYHPYWYPRTWEPYKYWWEQPQKVWCGDGTTGTITLKSTSGITAT